MEAKLTNASSGRLAEDEALSYKSDEFRMQYMKVLPCSKRYVHDWTECPYAHPQEKAKRRDPRVYSYTGIACPNMKKDGTCPLREHCPYAHNVFEYWLHPTRYRTQLCNDGAGCRRKICFFAHSQDELRVPATKPFVSLEALAAATAAASVDEGRRRSSGSTHGVASASRRGSGDTNSSICSVSSQGGGLTGRDPGASAGPSRAGPTATAPGVGQLAPETAAVLPSLLAALDLSRRSGSMDAGACATTPGSTGAPAQPQPATDALQQLRGGVVEVVAALLAQGRLNKGTAAALLQQMLSPEALDSMQAGAAAVAAGAAARAGQPLAGSPTELTVHAAGPAPPQGAEGGPSHSHTSTPASSSTGPLPRQRSAPAASRRLEDAASAAMAAAAAAAKQQQRESAQAGTDEHLLQHLVQVVQGLAVDGGRGALPAGAPAGAIEPLRLSGGSQDGGLSTPMHPHHHQQQQQQQMSMLGQFQALAMLGGGPAGSGAAMAAGRLPASSPLAPSLVDSLGGADGWEALAAATADQGASSARASSGGEQSSQADPASRTGSQEMLHVAAVQAPVQPGSRGGAAPADATGMMAFGQSPVLGTGQARMAQAPTTTLYAPATGLAAHPQSTAAYDDIGALTAARLGPSLAALQLQHQAAALAAAYGAPGAHGTSPIAPLSHVPEHMFFGTARATDPGFGGGAQSHGAAQTADVARLSVDLPQFDLTRSPAPSLVNPFASAFFASGGMESQGAGGLGPGPSMQPPQRQRHPPSR